MPIRPDQKARYPRNWAEISLRIRLGRAGNRCECTGQCGLHPGARCIEAQGERARFARGRVVLTVAHLDHHPEHCREENLLAMCQRCHLRYDAPVHARNAKASRFRKRTQGMGDLGLEPSPDD